VCVGLVEIATLAASAAGAASLPDTGKLDARWDKEREGLTAALKKARG
jgi:hypothetical protein